MHIPSFTKQILLVVSILFFVSCDQDYNEIGGDLLDQNNFETDVDISSTVESSWKETGAIASDNLAINSLGILDNSVFGQTTANFVTQVDLANTTTVIKPELSPEIESVILYIPYYSKKTETKTDGTSTYILDSIYGNKTAKIKLNIYDNKYFIDSKNDAIGAPLLDPDFPKLYYTNQNSFFNEKKGVSLYSNNAFGFSEAEIVLTVPKTETADETKTYLAPGMRVELDKTFFEDLLFNTTRKNYSISDNVVFKQENFKGLYFNVEKAETQGVLARMNFKQGTIVVKYKEKKAADATEVTVDKTFTLNLTGNTVSLLTNEPTTTADSYSSPKLDRLYLRGGEGSVATIDLFNKTVDNVSYIKSTKTIDLTKGNGIPDEIDYIKEKRWLINEASLTFYVDQVIMKDVVAEPYRIFLYDVNNKQVFASGIIEKDANKQGKYKVNITDYVRGLVINDNVTVTLGVSVAQVLTNSNFKKIENTILYADWKELTSLQQNAYYFPESSVMSPLGTVLYDSNPSNGDKKLKLEIHYTNPN